MLSSHPESPESIKTPELSPEDLRIRQINQQHSPVFLRRYTGKSTRIAIKIVQEALANPGKEILIKDHHGTKAANEYLARTVISILNLLGVDFKGGALDCKITVEPLLPELHYERNKCV